MKKAIFAAIMAVGMTGISGCVTGTDYLPVSSNTQSLSNASLSGLSNAVRNLDDNRDSYRNCLVEAYIVRNIEHEKLNSGRVDDSVVKNACSQFRDGYYTSVWASSYPLSDSSSDTFRHNTARTVIRQTDAEMFQFLRGKFPSGKTVTQQYVDDVRAAQ